MYLAIGGFIVAIAIVLICAIFTSDNTAITTGCVSFIIIVIIMARNIINEIKYNKETEKYFDEIRDKFQSN